MKLPSRQVLIIGVIAIVLIGLPGKRLAQTMQARPAQARLVLAPAKSTLSTGEVTSIRLTLLDLANRPYKAGAAQRLTLTVTTLETLEAAKQRLAASRTQPFALAANQVFELSADKESAQATCVYPGNADELTLRVASRRAGRIRIFAEAERFLPGAALISVLSASKKLAAAPLVEPLRLVPAVWQTPVAVPVDALPASAYSLEILKDGLTKYADPGSGVLIENFFIVLNDRHGECRAPRAIDVRLQVSPDRPAAAAFTAPQTRIEKGDSQTLAPIELRTQTPGTVRLSVRAIQDAQLAVRSSELPWQIEPPVQATGLALYLDRTVALASGLDGIKLTVKLVQELPNGRKRFLRPAEEGLTQREVLLELSGGFGVNFTNGQSKIVIPSDQDSGEIMVYGKRPVQDLQIIARSAGFVSQAEGRTTVSFYWPWLYLLWAALGGWGYRLLTNAKNLRYSLWGVSTGTMVFCLACLGAIAFGEVNFGPWQVALGKLPIESPFVPPMLGFFASMLIQQERAEKLKGLPATLSKFVTKRV